MPAQSAPPTRAQAAQTVPAVVVVGPSERTVEQPQVSLQAGVRAQDIEAIALADCTAKLRKRPAAMGHAVGAAGTDGHDMALLLFDAQNEIVHGL